MKFSNFSEKMSYSRKNPSRPSSNKHGGVQTIFNETFFILLIRAREKHYSLVWYILIWHILSFTSFSRQTLVSAVITGKKNPCLRPARCQWIVQCGGHFTRLRAHCTRVHPGYSLLGSLLLLPAQAPDSLDPLHHRRTQEPPELHSPGLLLCGLLGLASQLSEKITQRRQDDQEPSVI